ncbi:MAG TPA: FAD-binding oxidoreductase [Solirubrobacteraceae bacterium]|nr:FAD-binding oxidoreductase [Solirubrobacteraceae bacterium]
MTPFEATALREAVGGRVYGVGDDGYNAARLPWQRKHDPHPALVVEATGPQDVIAALRFARDQGLPFSVQSTGHGAVLPTDGGVLLKTTSMSSVEVDAGRRIARVGAGALWSDVIAAAAPHGLAPLSGTATSVGVVGYTLGGGTGWISRAYGFAADSVVRAHVVTADGDLVRASADENADLFWALRGGGGNFGVVTALEFRVYPVSNVYAGTAMFAADRAADVFAVYREWALDEPDESSTAVMLAQMPDVPQVPEPVRGKRVVMLRAFHLGDADEAERQLAPLRDAAGEPLMDAMRTTPFADAAAMLPPPPPMVSDMRFELFREVPDEAIAALVQAEGNIAGIELRHWGGEMGRPSEDAGPIGHRDIPFSIVVAGMTPDREQAEAIEADLDVVTAKLRPHATGGAFLNFLTDARRTADAYTEADYRRLTEVKATYDADNVFHANHSIPPRG